MGGNSSAVDIFTTRTEDQTTGNAVTITAKAASMCAVFGRTLATNSQTSMTNVTMPNLNTLIPGTPKDLITRSAIGFNSLPLKKRINLVMMMSSDAKNTSQR